MKTSCLLAVLLLSTIVAAQDNPSTKDYHVVADVQYCTEAGQSLLMDVFIPEKRLQIPTPAVLWLHGGGWERGDKNGSSGAKFLAEAGFVTASIYYRLSGVAPFPAAIEDCKCAIRYLRANASKYGIDPKQIGIAGASSGAHLALLVATADESSGLEGLGGWPDASSRVKAVASYYGPADFAAPDWVFDKKAHDAIAKFLGGERDAKPEAYRRASPITYVSHGDPPLLMVHGAGDTLVPFTQSEHMLEAYKHAKLQARLVKVNNANHDFEPVDSTKPISPSIDDIHRLTVEFFKQELVQKK